MIRTTQRNQRPEAHLSLLIGQAPWITRTGRPTSCPKLAHSVWQLQDRLGPVQAELELPDHESPIISADEDLAKNPPR